FIIVYVSISVVSRGLVVVGRLSLVAIFLFDSVFSFLPLPPNSSDLIHSLLHPPHSLSRVFSGSSPISTDPSPNFSIFVLLDLLFT
ncbi:hypothetical protein TorRG33x02_221010, partial [Trema orientale]